MNGPPFFGFVLLAAIAGCSKKVTTEGGILLSMNTDGSFRAAGPLTKLHVEMGLAGDAGPFFARDYAIPEEAQLPTSLGIASNGNPAASVTIDVSLWSGASALDVRRVQVVDVPTVRVETVNVVFSARCTAHVVVDGGVATSNCGPGETCNPETGLCGSDVYGEEGGGEAGASPSPDGSTDGSLDDGEGAGDGATDSSVCITDAGDCNDATPLLCVGGRWVPQVPCVPAQLCEQGTCRPIPPSCEGTTPWQCRSFEVPSGTFDRNFDAGYGAADASAPATVHGFRLDAYEVTVDRFNQFVNAVDLGTGLPEAGAGKHTHLNGGNGLLVAGEDGGTSYETGWDSAWSANLATNMVAWMNDLYCDPLQFQTYLDFDTQYGSAPLNCVTWYEAYAFCIWDGGFLPTEAEWAYAAAGGDEQRLFPWGSQDPGDNGDYAAWGCFYGSSQGTCTQASVDIALVGTIPKGAALWGQFDLAGNMAEWTLDGYEEPYVTPCVDCTVAAAQRSFRGGSFDRDKQFLANAWRAYGDPSTRVDNIGFRCAREP